VPSISLKTKGNFGRKEPFTNLYLRVQNNNAEGPTTRTARRILNPEAFKLCRWLAGLKRSLWGVGSGISAEARTRVHSPLYRVV
jgi:hypothetical protein